MIIQSVSPEMDVIIPNAKQDLNNLPLSDLIDQIELDNLLYIFEREKRTQRRLDKQNSKPSYILKKLITMMI